MSDYDELPTEEALGSLNRVDKKLSGLKLIH